MRRNSHFLWIGLLLVAGGCASPPSSTVDVKTDPARPSSSAWGRSLVATAEAYVGTPYQYGGTDRGGMDCSGLVYRVFIEHGVKLPRTSNDQFAYGRSVSRSQLLPGDLVFFSNAQGHVNHVGVYVGDGRFVHASTGKRVVRYDSLETGYFRDRYVGGQRIGSELAR